MRTSEGVVYVADRKDEETEANDEERAANININIEINYNSEEKAQENRLGREDLWQVWAKVVNESWSTPSSEPTSAPSARVLDAHLTRRMGCLCQW
jgi:hypothetical protein